jgi:hypothetical protein
MPTNPGGALGSLDYRKEDRHALAIKSREAPPKFGSPERQKLIDEVNSQARLIEQITVISVSLTPYYCMHRSMCKCSARHRLFLNNLQMAVERILASYLLLTLLVGMSTTQLKVATQLGP